MVRSVGRAMLRGFLERVLCAGAVAGNLELGNLREVRLPVWPQLRWRRLVVCPERALRALN